MIYFTKITVNNDGLTSVREYDRAIHKGESDPNRVSRKQQQNKQVAKDKATLTKRSIDRSRQNIISTVRNNKDDLITFVTLTYAENEQDIDRAYSDLRKYLRKLHDQCKNQGCELKYIFVPEFQKRGAIHFHGLINIPVGNELIPWRKTKIVLSEGKFITMNYYDLPFWVQGFSTAFQIEKKNDNFKAYLYLCKYIGKDNDDGQKLVTRQKVLKSKNLSKPKKFYSSNSLLLKTVETIFGDDCIEKRYQFDGNEYKPTYKEYVFQIDEPDEKDYLLLLIKYIEKEEHE